MVQLKEHWKGEKDVYPEYFNSFMVQLKEKFCLAVCISKRIFQFLHGTIKSLVNHTNGGEGVQFQFLHGTIKSGAISGFIVNQSYFNSFMVQLKAIITSIIGAIKLISIPSWYN